MGRGGGTAQSIAFEAGAEVRDQPRCVFIEWGSAEKKAETLASP